MRDPPPIVDFLAHTARRFKSQFLLCLTLAKTCVNFVFFCRRFPFHPPRFFTKPLFNLKKKEEHEEERAHAAVELQNDGPLHLKRSGKLMDARILEQLRISWLQKVRLLHRVLAVCHMCLLAVAILSAVLAARECPGMAFLASGVIAAASCIRIMWMVGSSVTQAAVASIMIGAEVEPVSLAATSAESRMTPTRGERRVRYKRWLWWGRFGLVVSFVQIIGAVCLTYFIVKNVTAGGGPHSSSCYTGGRWRGKPHSLILATVVMAWVLTIVQCYVGSDVLAWSSLYARHNEAWSAYYHEMFDYGIREALCCLGRAQYMNAPVEDEVDSVAALLGDLVSYRATGASHLEFLAGIALLELQAPINSSPDQFPEASEALIREATILHPYAVAAYTGLLLDVGRNPLIFPCAWLYRQGVLTPWNWNRRPVMEGDNWWRGHAAAFLNHVQLPPEALLKGRVHQARLEAAYFVTVVHQFQCIIVAIRGTETPEDLLTDGLGRECILSKTDLHGLLMSEHLSEILRQQLASTMPHFGHEGIVEAARELSLQLDNICDDQDLANSVLYGSNDLSTTGRQTTISSKQKGLLSSLLGPGGECEGYALRFVGHSLGGSIAALTAIRLYARYPNLHVYGYGVLPCLDAVTADACSSFVTSVVYNDEFSSRLSVSSLMKLRAAALRALASGTNSNSTIIATLARQFLGSERSSFVMAQSGKNDLDFNVKTSIVRKQGQGDQKHKRYEYRLKGRDYIYDDLCSQEEYEGLMGNAVKGKHCVTSEVLDSLNEKNISEESGEKELAKKMFRDEAVISRSFLDTDMVSKTKWPVEMFMPGVIIHLVPVNQKRGWPLLTGWSRHWGKKYEHKAIIRDRGSFGNIVVSPSMFLDHMPWRCQYALNSVLEHMFTGMQATSDLTEEIV